MILAFLLFGPVLFLALSVYALARKASQNATEAREMGLLASHLEGQLKQSEDKAEKLVEIAKHAIDEAAKVAGMNPDEVWHPRLTLEQFESVEKHFNSSRGNYAAPIVTNCIGCGVSVRHPRDVYPVHCPACQTLIDPVLDNPPEL